MADITKIQPIGDTEQYTLGARYLTHTPNNTTTFLRGDNTWSNTLTGGLTATTLTANATYPNIRGNGTGVYFSIDGTWAANKGNICIEANALRPSADSSGAGMTLGTSAQPWGTIYGSSFTGNSATASKLATARTISLTGSVTGSASFDGSANISIATTTNHTHSYLPLSGGTMTGQINIEYDKQIVFYGKNNNTSPKAQMGYMASVTGVMHSVNNSNHQTSGAFYIWSNGCDAANDNGGIAIDNEGVTVFGAGDAASNFTGVFRVVNEDDVAGGSIFTVQKGGGIVHKSGARFGESTGNLYLGNSGNQGWVYVQDMGSQTGTGNWNITQAGVGTFKTCKGAVWNDYAEMRNVPEAQNSIEFNINEKGIEESRTYPYAGRCVKEKGNGEMQLSTKRLEYGCKIISDTFGFCIGETDNCKTPIAVTGRVLAYPYEDIEILKQHIGEPVCSGPNGTVSLMTHEEEKEWPSKILGIISEIPNYSIWHCGVEGKESINVNGRIWIYVK